MRAGRSGRLVIASDFDGTLLRYDLAEKILTEFAQEGWRKYDELLAEGEITLEECMKAQYGLLRARSKDEILEYADRYCVFRAGTRELLRRCEQKGIEFLVVSAGLDFTIRYAFEKNGLRLPRLVCPQSRMMRDGSFGVTFPRISSRGSNYKERLVNQRRLRGEFVVFMGNGMGDAGAARSADRVFAIRGSTLDAYCSNSGIPHVPIDDFRDVLSSGEL